MLRELEIWSGQSFFAVLHIIRISTHLIHTVSGIDSHHTVHSRPTESTEYQVDSLIAAIAQNNLLGDVPFFILESSVLKFPLAVGSG